MIKIKFLGKEIKIMTLENLHFYVNGIHFLLTFCCTAPVM